MVFSSPSFVFIFLPVFFLSYFLVPPAARNFLIFVGSLFFYFTGAGHAALVLLASVLVNHWAGLYIHDNRETGYARFVLAATIVANLIPLVLYKYIGFLAHAMNDVVAAVDGRSLVPVPDVSLPPGISFFTFQGISYIVDIFQRRARPARSLIDFGMYHTSFPQLVAGPIVRYVEVEDRVVRRPVTLDAVEYGAIRFCYGFAKKIVIADSMGVLADHAFGLPPGELATFAAWIGIIAYTLQIFFDFSGYSDMAIGLGAMLGFRFPENFDQPYRSQSITEFWRRWHMTLSRWFRDYVYVPLGGNRVSPARTYMNLVIVFALCGLWHGAAYTFLVWGLYHGALLIVERIFRNHLSTALPAALCQAVTLLLVMLGWVVFRATTLDAAASYLAAMFGGGLQVDPAASMAFLTADKITLLLVGLAIALAPPRAFSGLTTWPRLMLVAAKASALLCFVYALSVLADSGFNPFIYFRF